MIVVNAIGQILSSIVTVYCWVVFVSSVLQMARADPGSQLMQVLYGLTEPAYDLVRRVMKKTDFNGIDFAPMIVIVVLQFVNLTVLRAMMNMY